MRNTSCFLTLLSLSFSVAANDYEVYYSDTPESEFPPSQNVLSDAYDRQQISAFYKNSGNCLATEHEQLLYHLGINTALKDNALHCVIASGRWSAADGQIYHNAQHLVPVPLWTAPMIERYYDYVGQDHQTTSNELAAILYSSENWKLIPKASYSAVMEFFPFNLNGQDVSSCEDLKSFTLFGVMNSMRFPRELTQTISRLEQFPECEKYLSLSEADAIEELKQSLSTPVRALLEAQRD